MNRHIVLFAAISTIALTSAAQAADLIVAAPGEVGVIDQTGSWDGPYVGAFVGYGAGEYVEDGGFSTDVEGWTVGLTAGADFTIADGIVAGVVGDIAWSNIGADFGAGEVGIDWTGSLRGRVGFDGGAFLPYLTAGLAVASAHGESFIMGGGEDTQTHVGWTAGAGVAFALSEDLSLDLLYRYTDYGTATYDVGFGPYDVDFTTHTVQAGLNWKF